MAIVPRFFSTTGAGAADGTTWADRAALFSAGNWSTVITGFAFNGSDSLQCFIGPGTYTCSQALASGLFSNPPSAANPLLLCGADSSGVLLAVPNPAWLSCQPAWDASTLPVIATTTNILTANLGNCAWYLIKLTASGATSSGVVNNASRMDWCQVINSASNTSAVAFTAGVTGYGLVVKCTGSSYSAVIVGSAVPFVNMRIEGVAGSSGNRRGISITTAFVSGYLLTIVNCGGEGVISTSADVAVAGRFSRCVIANNGAQGLKGASLASQTGVWDTKHCMITGNGTAGIDGNSNAARWLIANNRLRDNTTDIQGVGNYPTDVNNYTTDDSDANEYVSTGADGDFSIKNTASAIWGKGYGVRDQPATIAAQLVNAGALVG